MKYKLTFFAISFAKITMAIYLSLFPAVFFGGGSDSDYYDAYAQGLDSDAPNIWPVLLRYLNDSELYSRGGVCFFLVLLGVFVIPLLVARLAVVAGSDFRRRTFWIVAIVISAYPTLFYYSLDIYRDVFMMFIFLLGSLVIKMFIENSSLVCKIGDFFLVIGFGCFLSLLRPYLGFGFLVAFVSFFFFRFRTAPLSFCLFSLFFGLNLLFAFGVLEPVMMYREIFDEMAGGSNVDIRFDSAVMFLPQLLINSLYQLLGLYFPNYYSIVVFFLESVPFIIFFAYLIINRRYADSFVSYLVVCFLAYSIVWLLGNDNLGTAIRLRIFSYVCIFISAAIVFQRKSISVRCARKYIIGGRMTDASIHLCGER